MAGRIPDSDGRVDIKSLSVAEIEERLQGLGKERHTALQAYKWVWQRGNTDFDELGAISKSSRRVLAKKFYVSSLQEHLALRSEDGTRKYIWQLHDGHHIESVLIPEPGNQVSKPRLTLCMSSQVGCAMACTFCLTGDLGLTRNLRPSEIVNQALQVSKQLPEGERITNLVFMGMGEPLNNLSNLVQALRILLDENALNFSHRKVTVSTVGLVPQMAKLAEALPVNLAVSLNATTNEQRRQIMPITRRYSLDDLMQGCRDFPLPHAKRITFEYVMMEGFNCTMEDAERLVQLMQGVRCKVNLIPYNENPDRDILRPSDEKVKAFQDHLVNHCIQCSVRTTRGIDISAACGQLGKGAMGARIPEATQLEATQLEAEQAARPHTGSAP